MLLVESLSDRLKVRVHELSVDSTGDLTLHLEVLAKPCCGPSAHGPKFAM
jgi:hypothetical protein